MSEEVNNTQQEQVEVKSTILDDEQLDKIVNGSEENEDEAIENTKLPSEEIDESSEGSEDDDKNNQIEQLKKEIEELKKAQDENRLPVNIDKLKELGQKALTDGLSDKDYEMLEKAGYDKDTVDIFIEGLKAKQQAQTQNIFNGITDSNEYKEAIKYASENWTETDIKEFNALLDSGNTTAIRFAIKGLVEEYRAKASSNKEETKDIHKNTNPPTKSVKGYETKADMMKDMSDQRYGRDIAYTKKVEQKIAQTDMSKWY